MTPEGAVKAQVKKYLASLGPDCWWFMPMGFGYGRKGIPDFVGIYHGIGFTIETKRAGGKMSPWQAREARAVRGAGGIALESVTDVHQVELMFVGMKHMAFA